MQRVGALAVALLLPCCGGVALIGAFGDDNTPKTQPLADPVAEQLVGESTGAAEPEPAPTGAADAEPAKTEPAESAPAETVPAETTAATTPPSVTRQTVTERKPIAFSTRTVKDSSLAKGKTKVRTRGVTGVKTLTYEVTSTDGTETGRRLIRTVVTTKPVTKVVAVGTKTAPSGGGNCHPSYSPCVPVASDVDCAGGSGNGPAFVDGPIRVTGPDEYDLDRDGDGIACD
jgi:hypothetical protein